MATPAAKKLVTVVYVTDEDGRTQKFGPDDTLPAWARKAITNPKAFGDDPDEDGDALAGRTPDAKVLPVEKSGN